MGAWLCSFGKMAGQEMEGKATTNLSRRTPPKVVSKKSLPQWSSIKWKSPMSQRGMGISQTKGGSRGVDALDLQVYTTDDNESERDISDHASGIDWAGVGAATSPRADLKDFKGRSQSFDVLMHGSDNLRSQLNVQTQPVKVSKADKVKVKKIKLDSRYGRSKGLKKQLKNDDELKTMMQSEKQRRRDEKQRMKKRNEGAKTGQRLSVTVPAGSTGLGVCVCVCVCVCVFMYV